MNKRYETWSKDRRFREAVKKVLDHGWTQTESAKHYGVSRQHLNLRVKQARIDREEEVEKAKRDHAEGKAASFTDVQEKRRIPTDLSEFVETYFTNWICPDCQVHHQVPGFHTEISEAVRSDSRRTVVNIPPYHSKSTVITVWDTVMDICENPNSRTAIVSKSADFAKAFLYQINEIITNPDLYHDSKRNLIEDFGPFKPEGQSTWNQKEIYVSARTGAEKDPTVLAMGVDNQIYGRRFDVIKFDDVADVENQRNPDRVAAMLSRMDKEHLSRIGKNGKVIWVGTRVHPGDIYSILTQRAGYKVIRYPALFDDESQEVLWPEHFPYSQVMIHRSEMNPADFQLIYQNVDIPGLGASFTEEMLEACKDPERVVGHFDPSWRIIAGLDPAGGNKGSGYTAMTVKGIDLQTGKRYLIDQLAVKSMKAPQMKEAMFQFTDMYPIYEWRVESNGLQSQLVQYNTEIIQHLAKRGVRVVPHHTHTNKWDPQFGVEAQAPLMTAGLISIPWGNVHARKVFQPYLEELIGFPMALKSDRVMSDWFAELGCRELMERSHLPMFNSRMRVPERIRRRRHIVNFSDQSVRRVDRQDQRPGHMSVSQLGYRRMTLGTPTEHVDVREFDPEIEEQPSNIDPTIWHPERQAQ